MRETPRVAAAESVISVAVDHASSSPDATSASGPIASAIAITDTASTSRPQRVIAIAQTLFVTVKAGRPP
jgi:hypothetical protein